MRVERPRHSESKPDTAELETRAKRQQEEREKKLREMMSNAQDLEEQRNKRLIEIQKREDEEKKREEEERLKRLNEVGGSKGEGFLRDLHRGVISDSSLGAAGRIQRNRAYNNRDD